MAPILRSVNFAQITRGGDLLPAISLRTAEAMSKRTRIGIADVLTRGAGATLGCYFGYKLTGHWIPELEEKRQKAMRNAMGHSEKIEDLREKMWSDTKLVKVFSDLEKKLLSELSGVNLESMWSDLREKFGFDQRS